MTDLKFRWGVKLRKFILSPACRLLPAMRNNGPIEKNVFSANVDL